MHTCITAVNIEMHLYVRMRKMCIKNLKIIHEINIKWITHTDNKREISGYIRSG